MVKAIDFAIRTSADKIVRGTVSGDGAVEVLRVGPDEAISLNLSQSSVLGYERQGKDLVVTLIDGRQITLSGYFDSFAGEANKLYLSANGDVAEVVLTDTGEGTFYAKYNAVDTLNTYSNIDDIRFASEDTLVAATAYTDDTVGMGAFAPALFAGFGAGGLGTAAVVAGGLGVAGVLASSSSSGNSDAAQPRTVPSVNQTVGTQEISSQDPTVTVAGMGEPGATVQVDLGDKTKTTTINASGSWSVSFAGDDLPADGTYASVVTITDTTPVTLAGPSFVIDLTSPAVSALEGTGSVSDVENLAEYQDGVTIAGEGEPGATVEVVVEGYSHSTVIDENGDWAVTFAKTEIPAGENSFPTTITATDPMGNKTVLVDTIQIDTVAHPLGFDVVTADNVVNNAEASGEITVTGASTAGAMVTVTLEDTVQTVETDAKGMWSVSYPTGTFAVSDGDRILTATTVDAAGNTSSTDHVFTIDRTASVSFSTDPLTDDNVINADEAMQGVILTGQAEFGSKSVIVEWNGSTQPATVAADGSWSATFETSALPSTGTTTATVTATDAHDNTAISTRDIAVDWSTFVTVNPDQAGGDDIITSSEADGGITLTGTTDVDATVAVTFQGTTHAATAAEDGTWSVTFSSDEIARGTYADGADNTVTVTATDAAQNIATMTYMLNVDTEVTDFTRGSASTGADNVLNNDEAGQGLTVTGAVEAGSSVQVSFGAFGTYDATVTGTSWTVTIPNDVIPTGETEVQLTAIATDALGNVSAPYTEMIDIDRMVTPFTRDGGTLGGDGVLNAVEIANGLDLHGTGEVGATVVVALSNDQAQTIVVGDDGTWAARFEPNQLPHGEGNTLVVDVTATDLAGNMASFSESVTIDTVAPDAPNVTDILKSTTGATGLSGVFLDETIDSGFTFHRVGDDGSQSDLALKSGSLGTDYARFEGTSVPEGDYLVINHADAAGNDSATLLVTNNTGTSTVDLGTAAFHDFDFTSLDLTLAPANMTISAEDLVAITGPGNTLMIKGGADDQLTLQDAALAVDQSSAPDGFTLYTLGDHGASVYLDDNIHPTY